ncbi:hypothetical protein E2C01_096837 [Portunus trituberculatus]|uniref:Uncharacterized protein n=1 Tax=Portunus trituberculatus TaxID=210409 RepID=A0A5B7K453_PORTR|nr:hypothetical protein [Portunus trituberculatus]
MIRDGGVGWREGDGVHGLVKGGGRRCGPAGGRREVVWLMDAGDRGPAVGFPVRCAAYMACIRLLTYGRRSSHNTFLLRLRYVSSMHSSMRVQGRGCVRGAAR